MFLYLLNNEEAYAFIELSVLAIQNSKEKGYDNTIFDTYLNELNIREYKPSGRSIESILSELKRSTKQVRRTVVIELCGMLHSLKEYGPQTEAFIYSVAKKIEIGNEEVSRLIRWSNDFSEFLGIGLMYINAK